MNRSLYGYLALLCIVIFFAACSMSQARVAGSRHSEGADTPALQATPDGAGEAKANPYPAAEPSTPKNNEEPEPIPLRPAENPGDFAQIDSAPVDELPSPANQENGAVAEAGSSGDLPGSQADEPTPLPGAGPLAAGTETSAEGITVESPQSLMDTALDFYEASQEFWMQGILEKAMEALDQAYELILKVETGNDPDLIQQKDDLRYMISRRILELYASRYTAVNGNHNAIPLTMNQHVQMEINLFVGRERQFFLDSYRRSGKYRDMMVEALREAGMPEELSWLPLIESGFKVNAFSRARALGLWQFIPSTGYKFGLHRDTWIDERLDPVKATEAAIDYMDELHRIFGDWTTVLAAYNCGEGSVLKVIRHQRINYLDNFWDLYEMLPRETARYVPRFLAVLHILKDPSRYGITLPEPDSPIPYETVTINKQIRLRDVAGKLGLSLEELVALNPELRQRATPGREYIMKVPEGEGEVLLARIDEIPKWSPPKRAYTYHRVRRGQTLSYLAVKYRTSVSAIARANNISSRSIIRVGQRLKIPLGRGAYRSSYSYTLLPGGKYRVRRGDSLWLIAKKFKTDVRTLQQLNNLKSSTLIVGQVLKITESTAGATTSGKSASLVSYRVKKGDSLWQIAEKFNTDAVTIQRLNGLKSSRIQVGQVLKVPN